MDKTCTYILLEDTESYDRYGIAVSSGSESVSIPHITHSHAMAIQLLERLKSGTVTPCSAADVVEDFLATL